MAISHLLVVPIGTDCKFLKKKKVSKLKKNIRKFLLLTSSKLKMKHFFYLRNVFRHESKKKNIIVNPIHSFRF